MLNMQFTGCVWVDRYPSDRGCRDVKSEAQPIPQPSPSVGISLCSGISSVMLFLAEGALKSVFGSTHPPDDLITVTIQRQKEGIASGFNAMSDYIRAVQAMADKHNLQRISTFLLSGDANAVAAFQMVTLLSPSVFVDLD